MWNIGGISVLLCHIGAQQYTSCESDVSINQSSSVRAYRRSLMISAFMSNNNCVAIKETGPGNKTHNMANDPLVTLSTTDAKWGNKLFLVFENIPIKAVFEYLYNTVQLQPSQKRKSI